MIRRVPLKTLLLVSKQPPVLLPGKRERPVSFRGIAPITGNNQIVVVITSHPDLQRQGPRKRSAISQL